MEGLRELVLQDSAEFLEKELKAKPGKLKAKVGLMEQSLLHEAAEKGKLQSLNALIKLGANVNAHDKDRGTPLHYCSLRGHVECARVLLQKGAYADKQDADGNYAHHWAAGNSKLAALKVLVNHDKSTLRKSNKSGDTVLHAAARGDTRECIKLLVAMGSDPAAKNKSGDTPLHVAAAAVKQICVEELLTCTKNAGEANASGETAKDVAVSSQIRDLIENYDPAKAKALEEKAKAREEEAKAGEEEASGGAGEAQATMTAAASPAAPPEAAPSAASPMLPSPKPLTKEQRNQAMAHMSTKAKEKQVNPKSGHQKFLEKYNLASDPKGSDLKARPALLKAEE